MIKVNLVPRELLDREVQKQRVMQAAVVGVLMVLVLTGVSLGHWYRASRYETQLAELNQEYDKLAKIMTQVEELERTANAVKVRLGVITGLLKGRALYPYFMTDLLGTLPPGVWVTGITTVPKDPNMLVVTLPANASSSEGVTTWLRNLMTAGWDEPKLSAITVTTKEGTSLYTFSITTGYKSPKL